MVGWDDACATQALLSALITPSECRLVLLEYRKGNFSGQASCLSMHSQLLEGCIFPNSLPQDRDFPTRSLRSNMAMILFLLLLTTYSSPVLCESRITISNAREAFSNTRTAASLMITPVAPFTSGRSNFYTAAVFSQALMVTFVMFLLILVFAVFGLCFWKVRKDKKNRRTNATAGAIAAARNSVSGRPEDLLYFQHKAELDFEQRRHEMEAEEVRFEIAG